jgi:hypothetical protein
MWAARNAVALSESELRGSGMGSSVAMDGNYAAVGASSGAANHGCVYVFKRGGDGSWSQTAILTADDGGVSYAFGKSVGISGEWLIVGSRDWGFSNPISMGRVYFFKRNANETWTQKASLGPTLFEQYQVTAAFGASVAIEGDYAVAGDPNYGVDRRGSVTLFQRAGDVWNVINTAFYQPSPGAVRNLGYSVDLSVVGNSPHILAGAPDSNRAFHLWRPLGSLVIQELVSGGAASDHYFGHAVSFDWYRGHLSAAVGSCLNNDNQGAVYLFEYNGVVWTQTAKLTRPNLADGTGYYGVSVSLRNDVLAVGAAWVGWEEAFGHNSPVWLYYRNQGGPNQWGLFGQVRSQDYVAQMMGFGDTWASGMDKGVALSGDSLIVNAASRTYLVNGANTTGAAFVFGSGPGDSVRPQVACVRISEIADNSTSNGAKTAYIELYNPSTNKVSLADTQLAVGKNGNWNYDSYRFPPWASIPPNGCLVVSEGALMDDYEQAWNVDLDTAAYNYEIGSTNLHLAGGCSYRLEQVTLADVPPNPDTTNVLDTTVVYPGGCRIVRDSQAADDWHFEKSGPWDPSTPGTLDNGQFSCAPVALPFNENWSSYSFTSNNWTIYSSTPGKTNWTANNYPDSYAKFANYPSRNSGFNDFLASPLLSGRAKGTINLGFDLNLVMRSFGPPSVNKGYTTEVLVVSADGSTTNIVATYTDINGDWMWDRQFIDITSFAHEQYFRVLFHMTGQNVTYLTGWYLDNISVTATDKVVEPATITRLTLNPRMVNSLQMFWTPGANSRLHRIYYGTNLLEGINQPLGLFSDMSAIMRPPPNVNGAPAVFFRIQSLP